MRPTVVVFDLGGVLVDWNPRYLYRKLMADPAAIERLLGEVTTGEWNAELDRGRPYAEAVAELASRYPGDRLHIEAYFSRWLEMVDGPIAGTVAILEELHGRGVPIYALSNWSAETFPLVAEDPRFAFLKLFRRRFISGELKLIKPEPAIFHHLLAETGHAASTCLFVDDNRANVEAAAALGFPVHHFADPAALRADLVRQGLLA